MRFVKICSEADSEAIKKLCYFNPTYLGVSQTKENLDAHYNRLMTWYATKKGGRMLAITFENFNPLAMVTFRPLVEESVYILSDARTTYSGNIYEGNKNGIKEAFYELMFQAENMGFHKYYSAANAKILKILPRILKNQFDRILDKYTETIEEIIPANEFSKKEFIKKYIVSKKWPVDIVVRSYTLKPEWC